MLNRLIDEPGLGRSEEQLAELFRAAQELGADPFCKRRVLVKLKRAPERRPGLRLQAVVVATLLVSGTATAALGHRYVARRAGFFGSSAPVTPASNVEMASGRASPRTLGARGASLSGAEPGDAADARASSLTSGAPASAGHVKSGARGPLDSPEDASHVVAAIQALRTERDPSRAQGLLDDYLRYHPHGILSGDALALSIEAASAQHDPRATDYARRYLARFPHGKYRDLAKRALAPR
jgi:hypothetical protein